MSDSHYPRPGPRFSENRLSDNRKQSLYFPEGMLEEIRKEAIRTDRSLSWLIQTAWKLAKKEISKIQTAVP